jgi:hypothetical protein
LKLFYNILEKDITPNNWSDKFLNRYTNVKENSKTMATTSAPKHSFESPITIFKNSCYVDTN